MSTYDFQAHLALFPELTIAQRQRLGVEPGGAPLNDDGIVGPKTRAGIYLAPRAHHKLVDKAAWAALQGAREEGGNNRGQWPALFYGALDALPELDAARWRSVEQGPWCAAFVSWCIRQTYGKGQPQAWGARRLTKQWASAPGRAVSLNEALAGDLICWRREAPGEPAAGHIGIVAGRSSGHLLVMEGNGGRRGGAVGLYGYDLRTGCVRGGSKPQGVILVARRPDGVPHA